MHISYRMDTYTVSYVCNNSSHLNDCFDTDNYTVLSTDITGVPIVGTTRIIDGEVVNSNWLNVMEFRKSELQDSDWRDLPSYPGTDQEAWRTYREELRDIPQDYVNVEDIVWPVKP